MGNSTITDSSGNLNHWVKRFLRTFKRCLSIWSLAGNSTRTDHVYDKWQTAKLHDVEQRINRFFCGSFVVFLTMALGVDALRIRTAYWKRPEGGAQSALGPRAGLADCDNDICVPIDQSVIGKAHGEVCQDAESVAAI
ncbi:MAG: hypothetical protein R3C68_00640 [Myxococcota bacterium]